MPSQHDTDELQAYFTDVEPIREVFSSLVAAPTLAKHILVIHGIGGVGKTSLLRMFRLYCKESLIPVALASGDEAKSPSELLTRWANDLKADKIALRTFDKTLERCQAVRARVIERAYRSQGSNSLVGGIAGNAASKAAEAAGGAVIGAVVGSVVPGPGMMIGSAFGGALGGVGADALVDWLRGFLRQPDIGLLLNPTKELTDDFVADIGSAAQKKRIVLMLDTFEQMAALNDWTRRIAQRLPANILFVVAGRACPDWGRAWENWMTHAQIEQLKPMTEEVMRELVRRYSATMGGGEPDPQQVEAIIRFSQGLPMVVASAVQLWNEYGVKDFQSIRPRVVADLVDRLMEGVPKALMPALEAASIVRWFDQPILRAVTGLEDVREVYNELRRFPFVRSRSEGLALHDAVREIMDESIRAQDPERHGELHDRAASYFEKRLENARSDQIGPLRLEQLYHRVSMNEESGIRLFQETAERLVQYRLIDQLTSLVNDAGTYVLAYPSTKLWREYYEARQAYLTGRQQWAEQVYRRISEDPQAEPKLRAYALCDYGDVLYKQLLNTEAIRALEQISTLNVQLDSKLAGHYRILSDIMRSQQQWTASIDALEKAESLSAALGDSYGQVEAIYRGRFHYLDWGQWKDGLQTHNRGLELLATLPQQAYLRASFLGGLALAWAWMGRYAEGERNLREAIQIVAQLGSAEEPVFYLRDLAYLLALQGKRAEAKVSVSRSVSLAEQIGYRESVAFGRAFEAVITLERGELLQAEEALKSSIHAYRAWGDSWTMPLLLIWRGELYEIRNDFELAWRDYQDCLTMKHSRRQYHHCAALTGLVRVKDAQRTYTDILPLFAEAEELAEQYEYNDHLASLWLTQGHVAQDGHVPEWGNGFGAALRDYKQALIYALRYNRFLLDETLSGRPQGTPLRPVVPFCLTRGQEGYRMLAALRDWWRSGVNDIGTPRPDTISPIPEGIPLMEAESLARQREPGDGSPQRTVVEQIEAALSGHSSQGA